LISLSAVSPEEWFYHTSAASKKLWRGRAVS
jgi:hypothetical protein